MTVPSNVVETIEVYAENRYNQGVSSRDEEITTLKGRIDTLQARITELEADTPEPDPEPPPTSGVGTVPGQVKGRVLLGMSADDWNARVAQTGPVYGWRVFVPSWNVSSAVSKAKDAHSKNVVPYLSTKIGDWNSAANGSLDAEAADLAKKLAALGKPVRLTFHHEPRDSSIKSVAQLQPWVKASIRLNKIVRPLAPNVILGPTDNGFIWSKKGQGWPDSDINQIYTDAFLNSIDVIGADVYDGSTPDRVGETAAVKAQGMVDWAKRRGWKKPLDIGEWNFVKPADADAMWKVLYNNRDYFWLACIFNSNDQNREGIPTPTGSWGLEGDRLAAFKKIVAASK